MCDKYYPEPEVIQEKSFFVIYLAFGGAICFLLSLMFRNRQSNRNQFRIQFESNRNQFEYYRATIVPEGCFPHLQFECNRVSVRVARMDTSPRVKMVRNQFESNRNQFESYRDTMTPQVPFAHLQFESTRISAPVVRSDTSPSVKMVRKIDALAKYSVEVISSASEAVEAVHNLMG